MLRRENLGDRFELEMRSRNCVDMHLNLTNVAGRKCFYIALLVPWVRQQWQDRRSRLKLKNLKYNVFSYSINHNRL